MTLRAHQQKIFRQNMDGTFELTKWLDRSRA
jgi:hypothetical protein